jgi:prolyl oligopeptidase
VIYRLDPRTGVTTEFRRPRTAFDPSRYKTEQVFATSRDGTRVPLFVCRKEGVEADGTGAALLYGYGGFNISITPTFNSTALLGLEWMDLGGVFAVAILRGGGEFGEDWHRAGMKVHKQNVFDDFIACAEWLVAKRYAGPRRVAIHGRSNGGLLVGACMTQRPELFGATLPAVGVMDMLRFHKFTIGWAWVPEYGSSEDAADFRVLSSYSPLHNLKKGVAYPATLVTTADHDDRVVPAHSYKFTAALQAAQGGPAPILIRIETKAGHGAGKPTGKLLDEIADQLAFLSKVLGLR